jgi:hypothetical protein
MPGFFVYFCPKSFEQNRNFSYNRKSMRKIDVAGNWKMYELLAEAVNTSCNNFFTFIISVFLILQGFVVITDAQHKKIPKEPFQIVDNSTGKNVSEVLIIPRYYSASGVLIASPKVTGAIPTVHQYLKHPFIYKTSEQFLIKKPMFFKGLPLLFVFIGQFKDIEGVLVVATGYRPLWTDDLWAETRYNEERKMKLTPISDEEWAMLLKNELNPLMKGDSQITSGCKMWDFPAECAIKVDFKKKEKEMVSSFLLQTKIETK